MVVLLRVYEVVDVRERESTGKVTAIAASLIG